MSVLSGTNSGKKGIFLYALTMLCLVSLQSCGPSTEQKLETRAQGWLTLLNTLDMEKEDEAIQQIASYLEPSAGRRVRAQQYFEDLTNARVSIIDVSVDEVTIESDNKNATVRITQVVRLENGSLETVSQQLRWRYVDGDWFRAMVDSLFL